MQAVSVGNWTDCLQVKEKCLATEARVQNWKHYLNLEVAEQEKAAHRKTVASKCGAGMAGVCGDFLVMGVAAVPLGEHHNCNDSLSTLFAWSGHT